MPQLFLFLIFIVRILSSYVFKRQEKVIILQRVHALLILWAALCHRVKSAAHSHVHVDPKHAESQTSAFISTGKSSLESPFPHGITDHT